MNNNNKTRFMISHKDFAELVHRVTDPEKAKEVIETFLKYEGTREHKELWEVLGNKIIIYPYKEESVGPACYDVSMGPLAYSPTRGSIFFIPKGEALEILPGENMLVLTEEFLALPPFVGAILQLRVSLVLRGLVASTGKIDPTWRGRLLVSLTNLSKEKIILRRNYRFATLIFLSCNPVGLEKWICSKRTEEGISFSEILATIGLIFTEKELKELIFETPVAKKIELKKKIEEEIARLKQDRLPLKDEMVTFKILIEELLKSTEGHISYIPPTVVERHNRRNPGRNPQSQFTGTHGVLHMRVGVSSVNVLRRPPSRAIPVLRYVHMHPLRALNTVSSELRVLSSYSREEFLRASSLLFQRIQEFSLQVLRSESNLEEETKYLEEEMMKWSEPFRELTRKWSKDVEDLEVQGAMHKLGAGICLLRAVCTALKRPLDINPKEMFKTVENELKYALEYGSTWSTGEAVFDSILLIQHAVRERDFKLLESLKTTVEGALSKLEEAKRGWIEEAKKRGDDGLGTILVASNIKEHLEAIKGVIDRARKPPISLNLRYL